MSDVILTMKNINKQFPGVKALSDVDLEIRAGEVLALMGENGAGKSTLMKILTGIYKRDSGTIIYNGEEIEFSNPKAAQDAGIVIVHQELQMVNHLTVAQNIFVGREFKNGLMIDDQKMNEEAKKLFDLFEIEIDPKENMGNLTVGSQQLCEIAKAISFDAKIIVFDEPTAALTEHEIQHLFNIIRRLRDRGIGMVYISHRMDEIEQITDRVTVLRDGEYVGTIITEESTKDEIINMMVGRTIFEEPKQFSNVPADAETVLEVKNLNQGNRVKDVSFNLKKGEILGFSGLMGAGRTETARVIFGADKKDSGSIILNGKEVEIENPTDAVTLGIGYLSEDRKRFGLMLEKNLYENMSLASLDDFVSNSVINEKLERKIASEHVVSLNIRTPGVSQFVENLSGGNQQKVVVAKWLIANSDILIFDEPTRGIDVGAKQEIYELMNDLVNEGKSIIMISSELTEILRMSDRIVVMCEGRKTGELSIEEATQEKIMHLATKRD
ncbi:MAG: sugar ABC transporter ATP-binding protein [Clostridiaceae bacterium]|mgnify:CR=1 FL=1|nr:sugar ABC transporter ATP-binding protein [Clostridiaceae bacterium]